MVKEFKTIDELIALLNSRNIETDEQTALILKRESYYAIVNGYKDPFLDRTAMQCSPDDVYLDGTTFKQLYDLFLFDRNLRHIILRYLIDAESILKNSVVYAFCDHNRSVDSYRDKSNYASSLDMLVPKTFKGNRDDLYNKNISKLISLFNEKLSNQKKMRIFVKHYLEKYGFVPLWVLQNDLTFGNLAHFYQLQKRGVQNEACRIVQEVSGFNKRLTPHEILRCFDILVGFRNICAHDERLYCAKVKGASFTDMRDALSRVIPKCELENMAEEMNDLLQQFSGRLNQNILISVINEMHIPSRDASYL